MWNIRYCVLGAAFLLLASYLDNVRGPLIPKLISQFGFDYSQASLFLVIGHCGAVLCTFSLIYLTNRRTLRQIGLLSLVLVAIAMLQGYLVVDQLSLMQFAFSLGSVVAIFGSLSNVFVQFGSPVAIRGRALAGLHSMYGLGSFIAPLLAALALNANDAGWQRLFLWTLPFIVVCIVLIFPKPKSEVALAEVRSQSTKLLGIHWLVIAIFATYVGGEVLGSMWMTAYFVQTKGWSIYQAAPYLSLFFVVMAATRIGCLFFLTPRLQNRALEGSLYVGIAVFAAGLVFDLPILIPMIGLVGPFSPVMMAIVSAKFHDRWRSLTLWILGSTQAVLGILHLIVGKIATEVGMVTAYWLPALLLLTTIVLLKIFFRKVHSS